MSVCRTIGKEIEGLLLAGASRGRRQAGRRAELAAEDWTARVARKVLGKDGQGVSMEARELARLRVPAREGTGVAGVVENHVDGQRREGIVGRMLRALFPRREGYVVRAEQYLRRRAGVIAKDVESGESRRIDYVVFKDRVPVRSIEVTSRDVSKAGQLAKESRMRKDGARWLLHPETERMVKLPARLKTMVVRLP